MSIEEEVVKDLLIAIGEDPKREGLVDTPARVVRSWKKLFGGYEQNPEDILKTAFTETDDYDQMIVLGPIEMYSFCEHHMLPFYGDVYVGYLPDKKKVVGVSKLARLVECFARRLQIQERLTRQVANAFFEAAKPLGCAVYISAQHFCMVARGVEKKNAAMKTSALCGKFYEHPIRDEFYKMCGM